MDFIRSNPEMLKRLYVAVLLMGCLSCPHSSTGSANTSGPLHALGEQIQTAGVSVERAFYRIRNRLYWQGEFENIAVLAKDWSGRPAPELGPNAKDRIVGPPVTLRQFRGRAVLLYAFDAGNFVEAVDQEKTIGSLQKLDKACREFTTQSLQVIGFTAGSGMFREFWGVEADPVLESLTSFPLVLTQNRDFPLPYEPAMSMVTYGTTFLHGEAFCIIIDSRGRFGKFLLPPFTAQDLKVAIADVVTTGTLEKRRQGESKPAASKLTGKVPN